MRSRLAILAPLFLLSQAAFVRWSAGEERPPAPPALDRFPAAIGEWKQFREDPIDPDIARILHADRILSRTYLRRPSGQFAGLLVTWFASQRSGRSQPHSPKVCLPASGWTPEATGEMTLDTAAGSIRINRYIIANRTSRQTVLYWYQTPRRVIAGELSAKLWLVGDAVRDHRTDMALVRVVSPAGRGNAEEASATATSFAREVYPILRAYLPH